jgi:hypothetical protein
MGAADGYTYERGVRDRLIESGVLVPRGAAGYLDPLDASLERSLAARPCLLIDDAAHATHARDVRENRGLACSPSKLNRDALGIGAEP